MFDIFGKKARQKAEAEAEAKRRAAEAEAAAKRRAAEAEARKKRMSSWSDEDKKLLRWFADKTVELLLKRTKEEVPDKGTFVRIFVDFDMEPQQLTFYMAVEEDLKDKDLRRVCLMSTKGDYGYVMREYRFKGTKEEVVKFLEKENLAQEVYDGFLDMAQSWANRMGERPF